MLSGYGRGAGVSARCAALLVIGALLSACEKAPDEGTVGQKVDAAIDKTRDVATDVRAEAKTALAEAEARYKQDGPKVEARARDAATTAGKLVDDSAITAQIAARLARDPDLSALKIDVDTKDGVVVLRGPAPTDAARQRAGEMARSIGGVLSVDNQLIVKAG